MNETVNLDEHINYEDYYLQHIAKAKRTGDNLNGLCPFHEDHQASFGAETKTGKWKCLAGCGQGNVVSFHARINQTDTKTAFKDLCRIYNISSNGNGYAARNATDTLDPSILDSLEPIPPALKNYLIQKRGLSESILQEYRMGYSQKKQRYTIPIFDERGDLVNIRCYAPERQGDKVKSWATGYGQSRLYPLSSLKRATEGEGLIIVCEGEPDCLCGLSHGLNCITQTAGAETWKDPFNSMFKGLDVVIAYDNDQAGKDGAQRVAKHLPGFARSVEIIQWPDWMQEKEDLTDWFMKYGKSPQELLQLPRVKCGCRKEQPEEPTTEVSWLSLTDLMARQFEDNPIIDGLLDSKESLVIVGQSGIGKSIITLDMALHLAAPDIGGGPLVAGDELYGLFRIPTARRSIFIQSENTAKATQKRLKKMLQGQPEFAAGLESVFFPVLYDDIRLPGYLTEEKFRDLLFRLIDETEAEVVFFDPLISYHAEDENDNAAMRRSLDCLTLISDKSDITPIVIHHVGKAGDNGVFAGRGASAIGDWAANILLLTPGPEVLHDDGDGRRFTIEVSHRKSRNYEQQPNWYLERTRDLLMQRLIMKPLALSDKDIEAIHKVVEALEELGGAVDKQDPLVNSIMVRMNCSRSTAQRSIKKALEERFILVVPDGKRSGYRLPNEECEEGNDEK